jgi:hypothetical protein
MKSIPIQTTQTKGNDEVMALNVVQGMEAPTSYKHDAPKWNAKRGVKPRVRKRPNRA